MLLAITTKTDSYIQFMTVLILFVLVLGIAYAVTRWIAKTQQGRVTAGNLEVIETCRITSNKYVQIIRAGDKYLVIAVGKDEIHMLAQLSEDELVLRSNGHSENPDFASVLDRVRKLKDKEKTKG
ncbi:MAG: flagellar biosynthetic protein FliO [Suilimivivens sp.]|nr:flagellar biosynthetic protein FliO [Lachnospiraceae bacterium]MDY5869995.1 flagellar biosynthetic protein FliO [Lachnospiraceae bacterium]